MFPSLTGGYFEFIDILSEHFVGYRVFLDFGDHDIVNKIDLPKLLIIADFLIILGIDYDSVRVTELCGGLFFHGDFFGNPSVFVLDDFFDFVHFFEDDGFEFAKFGGYFFFAEWGLVEHVGIGIVC